jgi:lysophospholipid hydrolase
MGKYGTMQFGKFEEIQEKGYQAALTLLDEWDEENRLPSVYEGTGETKEMRLGKKRGKTLRRNSI